MWSLYVQEGRSTGGECAYIRNTVFANVDVQIVVYGLLPMRAHQTCAHGV